MLIFLDVTDTSLTDRIVSLSVPRSLRPLYNGFVGGIESISMVVAPLIGGALTTNVSWRWCFWINLPICVGTMVVIFLYVDTAGKENSDPWLKRLANLNLFGLFVFNSSIVCLLLALQWGGEEYAWSNRRVIAVLVIFAVFFVGFWAFVEPRAKERAVFPPRIMLKRDVSLTLVYGFCNAAAYSVMEYYVSYIFPSNSLHTTTKLDLTRSYRSQYGSKPSKGSPPKNPAFEIFQLSLASLSAQSAAAFS